MYTPSSSACKSPLLCGSLSFTRCFFSSKCVFSSSNAGFPFGPVIRAAGTGIKLVKVLHSNSEKTKTILLRGTKKEQCVTNLFVCKVTPRLSSNADVDTDGWRHRNAALVPVILLKIAAWGACALVAFFMQSLCLRACMVFVPSPPAGRHNLYYKIYNYNIFCL